jgi:hypothetical protein
LSFYLFVCAVVPTYEARWKAKSAQKVYRDIKYIKDKWGATRLNFMTIIFRLEKRARGIAKLILPEKMSWWGMAHRHDAIQKDESLC